MGNHYGPLWSMTLSVRLYDLDSSVLAPKIFQFQLLNNSTRMCFNCLNSVKSFFQSDFIIFNTNLIFPITHLSRKQSVHNFVVGGHL